MGSGLRRAGEVTQHLTLIEVLLLCEKLGDLKVRDLGLLDSAIHRPRAEFAGVEAYPELAQKAAALLHSIAMNHALFDGNKRLAWMACVVFLGRNGHRPQVNHAEAVALVLNVASGSIDDVEVIARALKITTR